MTSALYLKVMEKGAYGYDFGSREVGLLDFGLFHEEMIDKNYRIIRRLGSGGDGTVYLVWHLPTEQLRAAKCLKTDQMEKRMRELVLMKKLKHPSLPQILDVLEDGGRLWLVMEYISGRCIGDIPKEEVSALQFFAIAKQLAEVLIYLHNRPLPILHLDIKPSNVLIRPDGRLVLIDFGAAVFLTPGGGSGHYGTPGFAAPEQKNSGSKIDERADIYGFGALLYYYLYRGVPGGREIKRDRSFKKLHVYYLLRQCLREKPEERFKNSKVLYQAVCAAEKRYYRYKKLQKASGAMGLLAVVSAFAFVCAGDAGSYAEQSALQREQAYVRLLEQAEQLGFMQAAEYYGEAARLCPEKNEWCLQLIERIRKDYCFEQQEERVLTELIYMVIPENGQTFLEHQKENPEIYGELAYRLGTLYWYFYEGTGGKSAAVSWFEEAISTKERMEDEPVWFASARIHTNMGKYYEILGRRDENGEYLADYGTYWSDLKRLWSLRELQEENIGMRIQIAEELLSCMILHAYEIYKSGEPFEEAQQILESLQQFFDSELSDVNDKKNREEQCRSAVAAAERVFKKGEG
ncbi:MAG: serine/threonine-protein kinase [Lachnospiraceae bacterium]|nr:serine/threonine-protein kinase [Lachnospiraceae bacterium]